MNLNILANAASVDSPPNPELGGIFLIIFILKLVLESGKFFLNQLTTLLTEQSLNDNFCLYLFV